MTTKISEKLTSFLETSHSEIFRCETISVHFKSASHVLTFRQNPFTLLLFYLLLFCLGLVRTVPSVCSQQ